MDVRFKLNGFLLTRRNYCKSAALFRSVPKTVRGLSNRVDTFVRVWRCRTKELFDQNVIDNPIKIQCMRNCPPSIGRYEGKNTKLRFCVFYSCPWCWNRRYCEKVFNLLSFHTKTVDTKFYYLVKVKKYDKNKYDNAPKLYSAHCKEMAVLRAKLVRRRNVLGGVVICYLIPTDFGFKVITKILVSSTKPISPIDGFKLVGKTKNYSRASEVFGRYPTVLLKQHEDGHPFFIFLRNIPRRTRKFITFGQLYNRGKRCT